MTDLSIIGLGPMGSAIVELMLKVGKSVTIWNRTASKGEKYRARGAVLADNPSAALSASPVTLICLLDYCAVESVLRAGDGLSSVDGKLVINLGTGGPDEVLKIGGLVTGAGGRYLDAAIQAAPSQMGAPDTPILISGPSTEFADARELMGVLGGNLAYLGEKLDAAAIMDLATLSYVYGAFAGFLHGARMAEATGMDIAGYGALVRDISPSFGAFFEHEGRVIASGDFVATESPLRISVPAVRRILHTSASLGLNSDLPQLVSSWLDEAEQAGLADEELAAVIKVLRA